MIQECIAKCYLQGRTFDGSMLRWIRECYFEVDHYQQDLLRVGIRGPEEFIDVAWGLQLYLLKHPYGARKGSRRTNSPDVATDANNSIPTTSRPQASGVQGFASTLINRLQKHVDLTLLKQRIMLGSIENA